jgi:hypothetical protein
MHSNIIVTCARFSSLDCYKFFGGQHPSYDERRAWFCEYNLNVCSDGTCAACS